MNLPEKYKWLDTIGPLPKMVAAGLQYLGVREIPGAKNNPVIMDMAKGLGISDVYVSDSVQAWCAVFINHLIRITGKPLVDHHGDKYNLLRARWLSNWGLSVARGEEILGDVLIFKRKDGGHCALYIAETIDTYICLGGNQSNAVSFAEIEKIRLIACSRYYAIAPPASAKKYFMDSSGLVSTNEQ